VREVLQNRQSRCSPAWELIQEGYGAHLKLTTVRMNRTKLPKARACRGMPSNRPSRGGSRKGEMPPAPAPMRPSGYAPPTIIGLGCRVCSPMGTVPPVKKPRSPVRCDLGPSPSGQIVISWFFLWPSNSCGPPGVLLLGPRVGGHFTDMPMIRPQMARGYGGALG
jgi:hypothetical protein